VVKKMALATSKAFATRQTLEDSWRLRLEETQARYQKAKERYGRLLQEQPDGISHDLKGALALALHAQSDARAEYSRILRAFTDLTVNGKVPEERSATVPESS
jgi:hypothetical protein